MAELSTVVQSTSLHKSKEKDIGNISEFDPFRDISCEALTIFTVGSSVWRCALTVRFSIAD